MLIILAFLLPTLFFIVFFLRKLKVPTVVGYILAGLVLAYFFPQIKDFQEVKHLDFFYELAIALSFFYVGMEFPFSKIVDSLKNLKNAIIDFVFNFFPIFGLALLLLPLKLALIVALALYPSSTALVIRLLVEYKRLTNKESLYLIDILIMEDLIIILSLILLSPLLQGTELNLDDLAMIFLKLLVVGIIYLIIRAKFLDYLKRLFIESQMEDYFILFLIGTILLLFVSFKELGVIEYLGPFLFGSLVAEINKSEVVSKYLISFKEFSLAIFFFLFGLSINLNSINLEIIPWIIVLSITAIITKILSTYIALYTTLKDKEASLRGALSFVPRGEFSIILASMNKGAQVVILPVVITTIAVGIVLFVLADKIAKILTKKQIKTT
ncbi:MAG: cation:proton antiporter [Nanoarchaeota archaeon]